MRPSLTLSTSASVSSVEAPHLTSPNQPLKPYML
jgi:hypothetical protein